MPASPKRVHPHALRHTFAGVMTNRSASLHVIQQTLGPAKLETTGHYIAKLSTRALRDALPPMDWGESA